MIWFLYYMGITFLIILILSAYIAFINWRVFEKANKPGWASLIPIYNFIVLLDIIGYNWYYVFVLIIGLVPFIGNALFAFFIVTLSIKLAKSFGQSTSFGIGLWLLNVIFLSIIAFDKNIKYIGKTVNGDVDFNNLF